MPRTPAIEKRERLTLSQLATYDDILTDTLVDHVSPALIRDIGDGRHLF